MMQEIVRTGTAADLEEHLRANPSCPKEEMVEALAEAVYLEKEEQVRILLSHGADPNAYPVNHLPALHCAIEQRNERLVRLLANHGADVNLPTDLGMTPLHHAVDIEADSAWQRGESPNTVLTSLLLELGADPNRKDSENKTPLDVANEYDHLLASELLRQRMQFP